MRDISSMASIATLFVAAMAASPTGASFSAARLNCPTGMQCLTVHANGFDFECMVTQPQGPPNTSSKGDVLLLHGFPEWLGMFTTLMGELQTVGHRSAACNQRGYVHAVTTAPFSSLGD